MKDEKNYSLLNNNTFGIDESCRRFVEFSSVDELKQLVLSLEDSDRPLLIIGGGSNLLLTKPFDGTVLHSAIRGTEVVKEDAENVYLRCGSGETWDDIVELAVGNGWYGMENLSIIPGEVGASAVQNIGAYGAEAKDIIYEVEAVEIATGNMVVMLNAECQYGYRQSRFKGEWKDKYVIHHVVYRLSKTFTAATTYGNIQSELECKGITEPTARDIRETIIEIRNRKLPDPKVTGNAGSFFMNPVVERPFYEALAKEYPAMPHYEVDADHVKIPAGWLIDQCGWKGKSLGTAGVHSQQALVLVNNGGAKGEDIVALSDKIRKDVKERFGIDIYPEVNFV